jgi:hypothetical protein
VNNATKIMVLLMSFNVLLFFMLPELSLSGYLSLVYNFDDSTGSIGGTANETFGSSFGKMGNERKVYQSSGDIGGAIVHFIFELAVVGPFILGLFDIVTMPIMLAVTLSDGLGWGNLFVALIGGGYMILFFMSVIGMIRGTGDG